MPGMGEMLEGLDLSFAICYFNHFLIFVVNPSSRMLGTHMMTSLSPPESKSRKSADRNRRVEGSFNDSYLSIGSTRAVEKQRSPDRTDK